MLVDIGYSDDQLQDQLKRVSVGLYLVINRMANYNVLRDGWYEFHWEWPEMQGDASSRVKAFAGTCERGEYFPLYGSCDSPEQFLTSECGQKIVASQHNFAVTFLHMNKQDDCGYRWHKNGPYIGIHERLGYEYFEEEPNINEIYQFHVFRKK